MGRGRPEGDHRGGATGSDQPVRGVEGTDPAAVDDRDPIAEVLRLLHRVGDQQHGDAAVAHLAHQLPDIAAGARVQTGRELVEDHHPRVADERQRDREPLLLPPAQQGEAAVEMLGQSEPARRARATGVGSV